jgi:hypothetical protein
LTPRWRLYLLEKWRNRLNSTPDGVPTADPTATRTPIQALSWGRP